MIVLSKVTAPLVSIIIPVYNGEKYISAAIDSVMTQTFNDLELIIINDGSQDNTEQCVKQHACPQLRYYSKPNQGQALAINYALDLAQSDYIALLDADDIFLPHKIALQANILSTMPQIDMVFGYAEQFISPELPEEIKFKRKCPQEPLPGYLPSGIMFRKQCIDGVGSFDSQWRLGFFIDWYMRAKESGLQDYLLSDVIFRRRIHDHNQGVLSREYYNDYIRIVRAGLQRRKNVGVAS